ncbi:phage tail tape measure protein [Pseudomonas fluorescens]|uniref:phage tail tape measure protein n=1 Tax=Pseudomonas fluorescens TaxID=294 RepID=UPI001903FA67|nr:phage tail tape measure protein [Pseudomonas fluorescens]MBD8091001.1 phage tail tape measure protein [Pseudomonas fluorescens]MBD8717467.1 phage tail tape measure protein [Pseudomonas fluorescens]
MTTNFASLGISVESSQAAKAADDLDKLVDSAEGAQKAIDDLGKSGEGLANSGKKITQAESEVAQGVEKSTTAIDRRSGASRKAADSAVAEINVIAQLDRAMTGNITSMESLIQAEGLLERARKGGLVSIEEQTRYQEQLGKAFDKIEKAETKELAQKQRLIEAENRQIEALKRTVNGIDPVTSKLAKLEAQEKAAHEAFKVGAINADRYTESLAKIGKDRAGLTETNGAFDKLKLNTRQTQENVMQLTNALQSGDWGSGVRAVTQLGVGAGASITSMAALAAPIALAVAAIGTLAYAYYKGDQEQQEFNKSLILTGNAAGTTSGQLSDMSRQVGATIGTTGDAAAVLATLAGNGKIASGSFIEIAEAAISMEKATGKSVDATIAEFIKIAEDPVAAAKSLNDQYHFLTASVYSQVVALKEQGNEIGATKLLTDTYAETVQTRSNSVLNNLTLWEKAWRKIKETTSEAIDAVGNFDREKGLETQLKEAQDRLGQLTANGRNAEREDPHRFKEVTAEINFLQLQIEGEKSKNKYVFDRRKIEDDAVDATSRADARHLANLSNEGKRALEIKKINEDTAKIRAANPNDKRVDPKYVAEQIKDVNDKYKDPKAASTQVDLTSFNNAKNNLSDIVTDYRNAQKELEAQQKAGVVSLSDYAKQRSALINQEKDDVTAAYQAEIDALEAAKAKKGTTAAQNIQLDQKIADARQGMVKAQKDADSQLTVIATNEKGRLEQLTAASEAYVNQLERQRAALEAAGSRAANGLGLGDRQAALQASLDATTDKFNDERAKLLDRRKTAPDKYSQEDYLRDLASLEDAERKYRATVVDNYDQMSEAQGDWRSGASSAFQNYLQSANDVAGQTKSLFTNAFSSMEDAVANFAVTGKLSFSDFTKSILADMARIATRQAASSIFSSLAGSALGAYFGGGATPSFGSSMGSALVEGRASGGPVDPNTLYEVNEKGPELFSQGGRSYLMTGAEGGSVTPLMTGGSSIMAAAGSGGGGGGGNTYNFPVSISVQTAGGGGNATQEDTSQAGRNIQQVTKTEAEAAIARGVQPGGAIWRAINGR